MLTLQHFVRLVYSQISNPSKATILATTTVRLVKHWVCFGMWLSVQGIECPTDLSGLRIMVVVPK